MTARRRLEESSQDETLGFLVWRGRPRIMPYAHQHADVELNFFLRGSAEYFISGQVQQVQTGALVSFWAGVPHELTNVSPDADCVWVTVPLAWLLSWSLPEGFLQALLAGQLLCADDSRTGAADANLLTRWADDFALQDAERRRIVVLELEARIRRFALECGQWQPPSRVAGSHTGVPLGRRTESTAERIASYISRHYQQKLSIEAIAAAVNLHPNYAMTVFKQSCKMSIWEYLTRIRISHAQRLLVTTDAKILEVALESGFGSASRFYETFARFVGQTPRDYRAMNAPRKAAG